MGVRISVVGCGYLGLVHAACMAQLGHSVVAVDTDRKKIDQLRGGHRTIFEPGLDELLSSMLRSGRLRFESAFEAAATAEVHFVCVGTPQVTGGDAANTDHVFSAFDSLAQIASPGSLLVGKSTVPVGTVEELRRRLRQVHRLGDVRLAWNPEFLREGFAIADTLRPDRIVYGIHHDNDSADVDTLDSVYAAALRSGVPRLVTDYATAELVKVAANAFLATKISFINAIADVCEATGADIVQLADALGHDARIGRRFLNAGVGFGGGCLPKDLRGFIYRSRELGLFQTADLLLQVDKINEGRQQRVLDIARALCAGGIAGKQVAVLGASFKPGSDDVRESPALRIAALAGTEGAEVVVYDPQAMNSASQAYPGLHFASTLESCVEGAHVLLLLTEWDEFLKMDPVSIAERVAAHNIVDGRNCLDPTRWISAGWTYRGIGRGNAVASSASGLLPGPV